MTMSIAGKVAIVTGAGQGVGRGIALALARAGAQVILAGRTQAKLEAVRNDVIQSGGDAAIAVGDVTRPQDSASDSE